MATVTICAPLAACAACIISSVGYFAVPTISREVSSSLPMRNTSCMLSSGHRANDLHAVSVFHDFLREGGAANDAIVLSDRDPALGRLDVREQAFHRHAVGQLAHFAVNRRLHESHAYMLV